MGGKKRPKEEHFRTATIPLSSRGHRRGIVLRTFDFFRGDNYYLVKNSKGEIEWDAMQNYNLNPRDGVNHMPEGVKAILRQDQAYQRRQKEN